MSLHNLAPGVFAWLGEASSPDQPNAGLVIDADGVTVIDSLLAPTQAEPFRHAIDELEVPIRRLILTSSHVDRVGGSTTFPFAGVYGTPETNALLEQPPNTDGYRLLYPAWSDAFADDFTTRRVTHVVDAAVQLTAAVSLVPTQGATAENLVALVAGAEICFGGAMLSFGVTPLAFAGNPQAWAAALDELVPLATTFVPGNGPVGNADDVRAQADYLRAVVEAGTSGGEVPAGPWDEWTERDRDAINIERAQLLGRGDPSVPPSMLRRLGLNPADLE